MHRVPSAQESTPAGGGFLLDPIRHSQPVFHTGRQNSTVHLKNILSSGQQEPPCGLLSIVIVDEREY
jgi:hypothetical protein